MSLKEGDIAPNFTLQDENENTFSLSDYKGKKIVLYFYPKDNTSGCTKEACAFKDNQRNFADKNAVIIGISKDSSKSHANFKEKYGLPFILGADTECKVCEEYGAWVEKSMYGRKYMGIDRSTFLIDESGKILKIWRKVKVAGHIEAVLAEI